MKSILFNILWLLIEYGSKLVLALIFNGIMARALGVEEYGILQYSISLVTIFSAFSFICSAEVIVPKLVNANDHKRRIILGNTFNIRLLFSFIGYVSLLLFSYYQVSIKEFQIICIIGLILLVNESFAVVTAWLQANTNSKPRSILMIIGASARCCIAFLLYYLSVTDIFYYSFVWIVDAYILAIGLLLYYKKVNKEYFFFFSPKLSILLLKKGLPFFIGLLFMYAFLKMDVVFLKQYILPKEMGFYTASLQLFNTIIILAPIISISLAPKMVYSSNDINIIKKRIVLISIFMTLFSGVISCVLYFLSSTIINILFGNEFKGTNDIFIYMLLIVPLYFLSEGLNLYFIKYGLGKLLILKWIIALSLSLLLYILLIPSYGVFGAILSLGICYISIIIYSVLVLKYGK